MTTPTMPTKRHIRSKFSFAQSHIASIHYSTDSLTICLLIYLMRSRERTSFSSFKMALQAKSQQKVATTVATMG